MGRESYFQKEMGKGQNGKVKNCYTIKDAEKHDT